MAAVEQLQISIFLQLFCVLKSSSKRYSKILIVGVVHEDTYGIRVCFSMYKRNDDVICE